MQAKNEQVVFWRADHPYETAFIHLLTTAWLGNVCFYSFGTEPLPGAPAPLLTGVGRKTIGGNYRNPPVAKSPGWQRLQIHDVYDLPGWKSRLLLQDWFSVCLCTALLPACLVERILNLLTVAVKLYFWVCNPVQKLQMFKLFPPRVWWK